MSHPADSGAIRETRLLHAFVELADTLVDDYDVVDVLHHLVENCVQLLDVEAAGLLLSDQRGGLRLVATSSEHTRLLELFQLESNEGPCLDCYRTGEPVLTEDIEAATDRWPLFARRAAAQGFHAVHAVPLRLRRHTIGGLNLFNTRGGPMDPQDLRVARALADTATIGILQERAISRGEVLTEQLQTALNNRVTIEQAKGLLAHAGNLDMDQAFQCLRHYGRSTSTRLSEVAHQLVTGILHPRHILTNRPQRT